MPLLPRGNSQFAAPYPHCGFAISTLSRWSPEHRRDLPRSQLPHRPRRLRPRPASSPQNTVFPYRIDFENAPSATAPAQRVVITDPLDPNLDWSTLQLTGVGFGDTNIAIPPDSQYYATTVPMTENGESFVVEITISLNPATGLLTAVFQSIDPNTELPPDVLTGFLPPEDGTGRGMGFISFIVDPKPGLPTGTQIRNVALITFDANPAIATDQVNDEDPTLGIDPTKQALNTIDSGPPTQQRRTPSARGNLDQLPVTWSGQDDPGGSGIASYDIYVSDDGGPYTLWQADITATSAKFTGQHGQTYAFFSVATDNVGNVQATPTSAQATTQLRPPVTISSIARDHAQPTEHAGLDPLRHVQHAGQRQHVRRRPP